MVDSVNSGSDVPLPPRTLTTGTSGTSQTTEVSQGYSETNSVSSSSEDSQVTTLVSLTRPTTVNASAEDFLSRSIEAKLDGFLGSVRQFNLRINPQDVDINDSDSLLLMIKSMVSSARALVSAQNIDQAYSSRDQVQSSRQNKTKQALVLKARIRERQQSISDKQGQATSRAGTLADKQLSKTLKEHKLANARATHSDSNDQGYKIAQLQVQLQLLDHEIANLQHEMTGLGQDIYALKALNVADSGTLSSYQRALDSVGEEFVTVRSVLARMHQRFDDEAMETGEKEKLAVEEEGREAGLEARREEMRLRQRSDQNRELDRSQRQSEAQRVDSVRESELLHSQAELLTREDVQLLGQVFARHDPAELQAALTRLLEQPPKGSARPGPEEGLAIVLQSHMETPAPGPEEVTNPAAQPFMGDNLSLEGATNPQIFARLWLEARMAEGDKTQEAKEAQLDDGQKNAGQQTERLQRQTFADALQEFQAIPEETGESLDKARQAEAYISRNSRV